MSQKPVSTREWYDFVGQLADLLPDIHPGGLAATRALLDLCRVDATSQVLDVGCGSGTTACLIAQEVGSQVLGIDISEVMIAEAKERARQQGLMGQVEFRVADVFQMPFEDASFDVALFQSVLTPLPGDVKQALTAIGSVIRPGGRIGANEGTVDPSAPPEFLALFDRHPAMYRCFTPRSLRSLFEESGLRVVEMREVENAGIPDVRERMGLRSMVSFIVRVYPKMLVSLLRDARLREASRIDDRLTNLGKQHMGYTLIVGQKPERSPAK